LLWRWRWWLAVVAAVMAAIVVAAVAAVMAAIVVEMAVVAVFAASVYTTQAQFCRPIRMCPCSVQMFTALLMKKSIQYKVLVCFSEIMRTVKKISKWQRRRNNREYF
jgi:hypothetical protein